MKRMDNLLCSSPASTAIIDQRAIVRRDHRLLIEDTYTVNPPPPPPPHHHHRDHDGRMKNQPLCHIACSSDQSPVHPKSFYEKCRRSFSWQSTRSDKHNQPKRKSCADMHELRKNTSSRYLLREDSSSSAPFIDRIFDDADLHLKDIGPGRRCNSPTTSRPKSTPSQHQVVVSRVSLHCKGCERKLRKHLSKRKWCHHLNIDLSEKKVTVIGEVTPLGVLTSVSKVKNAQLWPSTTYSSSRPACHQWSAG